MGISHPSIDIGAEADQFRESIDQYETTITLDNHDDQTNTTTIEYASGEGDPPYIKYRMTLEAIELVSPDAYSALKHKKAEAAE